MTVKQIKADLRSLAKKSQIIAGLIEAKQLHERCIENVKTAKSRNALKSIAGRLNREIEDFILLEQKYLIYIHRLDKLKQEIVLDHYVNGTPIWKIANRYNYHDQRICQLINEAIGEIERMHNKKEVSK